MYTEETEGAQRRLTDNVTQISLELLPYKLQQRHGRGGADRWWSTQFEEKSVAHFHFICTEESES